MLTIRKVYKADELKRFKELEGKYHYMKYVGTGPVEVVVLDENEAVLVGYGFLKDFV